MSGSGLLPSSCDALDLAGSAPGLQGRRILVIGQSGAGKSTLARRLAAGLAVPHVELDALHWGPGWRALSSEAPDRWIRSVADAVEGPGWVADGNYAGALPVILPLASDVVWLDYSRTVIMVRVIRRSFSRALFRTEIWPGTGNRESFRDWLRDDHPILWSWSTYRSGRLARAARLGAAELGHVRKHRLRTPRDTRLWLDAIRSARPTG